MTNLDKNLSWSPPQLIVLPSAVFTQGGSPGTVETNEGGNGPLYPASG